MRSAILPRLAAAFIALLGAWCNSAQALQPGSLAQLVEKKAAALALVDRKAAKALANAAQDPAFKAYFDARSAETREALKRQIDEISLHAQERFAVPEMCLIERKGAEVSRSVDGQVAHDLDLDESAQPFFQGAIKIGNRQVYRAPAYYSKDSRAWVVSYATPIRRQQAVDAVLHYEHSLDMFHQLLVKGLDVDGPRLIVVESDGRIIMDSRSERHLTMDEHDTFPVLDLSGVDLRGPAALAALAAQANDGPAEIVVDGVPTLIARAAVGPWQLLGIAPAD